MKGITSFAALAARLLDDLESGALGPGYMEPIRRGSASGFVMAIPGEGSSDSSDLILVTRLEIMPVPGDPVRRRALEARLLELNHGLLGRAAFSFGPEGAVYLTAGRPVEDLDPGEILDLILWTSEQADRYDDELIRSFGSPGEG